MTDNFSSPAGPAMVKIDGEAIRRLREGKGLTQLYVATVVGVTTDTISRWENRRYPFIKRENALRLAEALETKLAALLEEQPALGDPPPDPPALPPPSASPASNRPARPPLLLAGLLVLVLATGLTGWLLQTRPIPPRVEAVRILPSHAPPGQIFPVLIRVTGEMEESTSLILKEELPATGTLLRGEPGFTSVDRQGRSVKWIGRLGRETISFAYLVQSAREAEPGAEVRFRGSLVLGQGLEAPLEVTGPAKVELAPYHWADYNRDGRIDDEEILTVYDLFSQLEDGAFDWKLIEEIWAAEGYRWDRESGRFELTN